MVKTKKTDYENDNALYRIGQLEKNYESLNAKIELMMTNHLPHIKEDMIGLKTRINLMTAINIGGIILGIIVARVLQ